jgi:hypothetical protein
MSLQLAPAHRSRYPLHIRIARPNPASTVRIRHSAHRSEAASETPPAEAADAAFGSASYRHLFETLALPNILTARRYIVKEQLGILSLSLRRNAVGQSESTQSVEQRLRR